MSLPQFNNDESVTWSGAFKVISFGKYVTGIVDEFVAGTITSLGDENAS